jgi:HB1, ASXL, restriction endonuclease HTH domain
MTSKPKTPTSTSTSPQTLKIGSRVRCTDDRVEGRIVWANAFSVKIRWNDGEQVTWRRDSLAGRPIEILDEGANQVTTTRESAASKQDEPIESPSARPEQTPTLPATEPLTDHPAPAVEEPSAMPPAKTAPHLQPSAEATETSVAVASEMPPQAHPEQRTSEQTAEQPQAASPRAKRPRQRNPLRAAEDGKEKKLSALDAAALVLAETGLVMTCQELIAAMAEKGYWTSPGGRTPAATLYSAMLREITAKGANSRFRKTERGKFCRNNAV